MSPPSAITDVRARLQSTVIDPESSGIFLGEDDERIMQGMLHEERNHLAQVDQEIHRLESVIAGLYTERKACIGRLNKYALSLAPHKRLPSELLAQIFLEVQGGEPVVLALNREKSPWVLRRVCSQWRRVVQGEVRLWSELDIQGIIARPPDLYLNTWVSCFWGRDKSFPVSLRIAQFSALSDAATCRVLAPYSHRFQNLSLYLPKDQLPSILSGHSFDALESLILIRNAYIPRREDVLPGQNQPLTLFTASTKPRKVTFTAYSSEDFYLPRFYKLLWSQLTHLTFHMVRLPFEDLKSILRQSKHLLSLTFTSIYYDTDNHSMNPPEISLPHLQSVTVLLEDGDSYWSILSLLRVPLLKEIIFDNSDNTNFELISNHDGLVRMIERSGCSIKSLSLLGIGTFQEWKPKGLLRKLPGLVRLVVSETRSVPGFIFDMVAEGQMLQNLEHLECVTGSPIAFLKLMERECLFKHRGISIANVTYYIDPTYEGYDPIKALDMIQERYEGLKSRFQDCGKGVVLKRVIFDSETHGEEREEDSD